MLSAAASRSKGSVPTPPPSPVRARAFTRKAMGEDGLREWERASSTLLAYSKKVIADPSDAHKKEFRKLQGAYDMVEKVN